MGPVGQRCDGRFGRFRCDRPAGHIRLCEQLLPDGRIVRWNDRRATQFRLRLWRKHIDEAYGITEADHE